MMERPWSYGGAVFCGEWALQAVALGPGPPPRWRAAPRILMRASVLQGKLHGELLIMALK